MQMQQFWLFRKIFSVFLLFLFFHVGVSPVSGDEKKVLSFGVVPQQSASKLARKWVPIIDYISTKSSYKINFATAPDIPEFERRLQDGQYSLAYMNPYHYTVFSKTTGYRAFAKQKGKRITGILVVRKDADISSPQDLVGKTLAFPSPAAFAATILTQESLLKNGVDITPKYVGSHDSVYRTVAKGIYPAGGGVVRTLNNMEKDVREHLRILWTSKPYTPHAFASHPSLSDAVINKILHAMTGMNDDPKAAHLLESINFKGFESAQDGDWDDIRSLNIKELHSMSQQ
jgi:phosphonate transport system substrate-binding protein